MLEQGPDFWHWFDTTQFSYHCVHPKHAKMFSIQILLHFSQIVLRVCTLVLFISSVLVILTSLINPRRVRRRVTVVVLCVCVCLCVCLSETLTVIGRTSQTLLQRWSIIVDERHKRCDSDGQLLWTNVTNAVTTE